MEQLLPWFVLIVLLYYSYALFVKVPYAGILFSVPDGRVTNIYVEGGTLQTGDLLLQVGSVSIAEMTKRNPAAYFFQNALRGEMIPGEIERDGNTESVLWRFPGFTWLEALQRFDTQWWLAYVFWVGGAFTLLLVRPRDDRWRLLTAFNFLIAVCIAAGTVSVWNFGHSRGVFRAAIWLAVPVALQFHWVFPTPLPRLPRWFRLLAYLVAVGVAAGDFFYLLPASLYWYGFLILLGGSALIVLWRLLFRPVERRELGLLLGTLPLVLLPPAVVAGIQLLGGHVPRFVASGTILGLPAVPGAYFYILYRRQLGRRQARAGRLVRIYVGAVVLSTLLILLLNVIAISLGFEDSPLFVQSIALLLFSAGAILGLVPFFSLPSLTTLPRVEAGVGGDRLRLRANRLLTPFLFIVVASFSLAATLLLLNLWFDPAVLIVFAIFLSFLLGHFGYPRLERLVERYLLGIRLQPAHLLEGFAARITTCLDRESLVALLEQDILPSLLVRQSVLLHRQETNRLEPILCYGVEKPPVWQPEMLEAQSREGGGGLGKGVPGWVQLVIPLRLGERTVGCWLWGARDPDDLYRPHDVRVLQALADQTAIALANIVQTESLHALYQAHIDGREEERTRLALALHDEILNELAILNVYVEEAAPPFYAAYENVRTRLRDTISDLRPAMLNHGLGVALEELVEDLQARLGEEIELELTLHPVSGRYPLQVEGHLFRIVQQALENALKHARADKICLKGTLAERSVQLVVADDGVGFPAKEAFTLPALLARKHFGLVGMYERAALIGAEVTIHASPGEGTTVAVRWTGSEQRSGKATGSNSG